MTFIDEQKMLDLRVVRQSDAPDVSDAVIKTKNCLTDAVFFSIEVAGLQPKAVCIDLLIDGATLSKIKSGTRHFPPDKIEPLMDITGNEIPLRWLALKRGYGLVRLQSEVERENALLLEHIADLQRERVVMEKCMRLMHGKE